MVAKTLMLSQLTYFGSILEMSEERIKSVETIFVKFIIQNLKVSKKDVSLPIQKGGLG
jgi:archaellum biogenesis protein FlaJ (TadC family)